MNERNDMNKLLVNGFIREISGKKESFCCISDYIIIENIEQKNGDKS